MKTVTLKVPDEDALRWKEEAHELRLSLSELIRQRMNGAPPIMFTIPANATYVAPVASEPAGTNATKVKFKSGSCANRLPKGSFCKQCGKLH